MLTVSRQIKEASMSANAVPGRSKQSESSAFHASRRFAATPFGRIAHIDRGSGLAVLFFHGWPLNSYQWRGVIDLIAPHRRCLAPDLMGLGYSECPAEQDVSPSAQADMIPKFLDAVAASRVDVIANDSGGAVAQLFATRYPERVRSLLFTNCEVHTNTPPPSFLPVIEAARHGVLADRLVRRTLEDPGYGRRKIGEFYANPESLSDESLEVYLRPLAASPERTQQFHVYTAGFLPNPLPEIEPLLRACTIPARMVWGTASPIFGIEWARWLDAALPRSRGIHAVEGGNLFFPEERPDVVAREALAFWRSVD
jgi:haloalkane dehalogenase